MPAQLVHRLIGSYSDETKHRAHTLGKIGVHPALHEWHKHHSLEKEETADISVDLTVRSTGCKAQVLYLTHTVVLDVSEREDLVPCRRYGSLGVHLEGRRTLRKIGWQDAFRRL